MDFLYFINKKVNIEKICIKPSFGGFKRQLLWETITLSRQKNLLEPTLRKKMKNYQISPRGVIQRPESSWILVIDEKYKYLTVISYIRINWNKLIYLHLFNILFSIQNERELGHMKY